MNCFLNSIPIADDRVLSSDGGWELYREYDRNEFLKSIENKKQVNVKYIFKQHTNSQEHNTSFSRMLFTIAVSLCTSCIGKNALVCHSSPF